MPAFNLEIARLCGTAIFTMLLLFDVTASDFVFNAIEFRGVLPLAGFFSALRVLCSGACASHRRDVRNTNTQSSGKEI